MAQTEAVQTAIGHYGQGTFLSDGMHVYPDYHFEPTESEIAREDRERELAKKQ